MRNGSMVAVAKEQLTVEMQLAKMLQLGFHQFLQMSEGEFRRLIGHLVPLAQGMPNPVVVLPPQLVSLRDQVRLLGWRWDKELRGVHDVYDLPVRPYLVNVEYPEEGGYSPEDSFQIVTSLQLFSLTLAEGLAWAGWADSSEKLLTMMTGGEDVVRRAKPSSLFFAGSRAAGDLVPTIYGETDGPPLVSWCAWDIEQHWSCRSGVGKVRQGLSQ